MTQSKTDLDKGLKLSRKLHKEMALLADFISETNAELSRRQSPRSQNVDEELVYVKVGEDQTDWLVCVKVGEGQADWLVCVKVGEGLSLIHI